MIELDPAFSPYSSSQSGNTSFPVTVSGSGLKLVVVISAVVGQADSISTITYNGNSFNDNGGTTSTNVSQTIYSTSPSANGTVEITTGTDVDPFRYHLAAILVQNVNPATSISVSASNGSGTDPSTSDNTQTWDFSLAALTAYGSTTATGGSQTEAWNESSGAGANRMRVAGAYKTSTYPTTSLSWTLSLSTDYIVTFIKIPGFPYYVSTPAYTSTPAYASTPTVVGSPTRVVIP